MSELPAKDIFDPEIPTVPSDWKILNFDDAISTISDQGRRVKKRDYLEEGGFSVIDQGQDDIGGYTSDERMLYEGELPVIIFGDHTLVVKYVDRPFVVGADGVKLLRPKGISNPKYLYYLLQSLRIPSRGYSRHFQFLKRFKLPVAPEEQQTRIVAEIEKQFSRLDEAVASLERVKANLKRYKAAVLKAAVEGKLTEEWRKQNPNVEPASKLLERILAERSTKWEEAELAKMKVKGKGPKNDMWKEKYKSPCGAPVDELAELPEKWAWATWDEISNWVTYGFTRPMEHVEFGVPIVTAKHVVDGRIDFTNTHKTPATAYEDLSDKDRPYSGDILVTKDGTIGRAAVVPEHSGFCINQSVAVIWLRSCPFSRRFLLAVIQSDLTQKPIAERARGVAIKHLSITDFAKLPVPVAPLEEQRAVTELLDARLSVVEEVESEVDSEVVRCSRVRQSILARAFSGDLLAGIDEELATKEYVR